MKLYEINEQILACTDPETGEIFDVDKFVSLNMERDEKIEQLCLWVKDLTAEAKAIREEEKALAERRRAAENKADNLKQFLKTQINGKFTTAKCSVSIRNNAESPKFTDEAAFIEWAEKNHEEMLRYKQPEIDKAAVKAYLQDGNEIDGVTLERSQSLIIK